MNFIRVKSIILINYSKIQKIKLEIIIFIILLLESLNFNISNIIKAKKSIEKHLS